MTLNPVVQKNKAIKTQNKAMIKAALAMTKRVKAKYLFLYLDAIDESLLPENLPKDVHIILISKKTIQRWSGKHPVKAILTVPKIILGRMGLIKYSLILAISAKLVTNDDTVVFLSGKAAMGVLDLILVFNISDETELLLGTDFEQIPQTVKPAVFEQVLNMAIELSTKGREGKPVGTIFVIGDDEKVMQLSKQMIMNPFKGYEQDERNILNPLIRDTIFEFSALDGAFVISGEGEVITAGRYLGAASDESEIPRGLGARHIAAAGITALTKALAVVISESTGDVRIFRNGRVMMSIEKPSR